jgi:CheY-like chemotaxis protein
MSAHHALIIDDNAKNVYVLVRLLNDQDVTTSAITNPRMLDGVLSTLSHLDVVFVDLEMPGQNGYDVLASLRAHTRFHGVSVVAYTVHTSDIHIAQQAGFDSFIGKPLDLERFPGQLTRILRREPVWESA